MKSETFDSSGLNVGLEYSRLQVAETAKVAPPKNSRDWTGIVPFENCVLFFVTLEKGEGREDYAYNDYFDGNQFSWESQNRQTQVSPVIKAIIDEEIEPLLFVRLTDKLKGLTQPFVYCGRLKYTAHAGENPVEFWFLSVDYKHDASGSLAAVYQWKPAKLRLSRPVDVVAESAPGTRGGRGQGRQIDPVRRKKVEQHAMGIAMAHYKSRGYLVEDTSAFKPYDLICTSRTDLRRVEVKGTISDGTTVEVTAGEVNAARQDGIATDLFIVSLIEVAASGERVTCSGGVTRLLANWNPSDLDLEPTSFRFTVSAG